MPRLLTTTIQSESGHAMVRVRQWDLPSAPYPVIIHSGTVPTSGRWLTRQDKLRGIAESLLLLADQLDAERE